MNGKINSMTRRRFGAVVVAATSAACAWPARAETRIGTVEDAVGDAFARQRETRQLQVSDDILLDDYVWTGSRSRARLGLDGGTRIHLGPHAQLVIDRFVAQAGGDLVLGTGALVFDRAESLPPVDMEIRSAFGLIGVRGTRFFAGPSRGVFGVFVERGTVEVQAAGIARTLRAGDGVDIPAPGAPPTNVVRWGQARIDEALASVLG
ncbi:FecR family protein [Marinivivus vitaminiproducens]|uniref:FecR family protein n=1 Tax=Marinivivus vitaminiproducens TaxID=3035935 RepID=UPI0027A34A61|nr:FecR family protein [Geminicoccaceae bacterium SCSIO 64248]